MNFDAFAVETVLQGPLRRAITQAYRMSEPDCVTALIPAAALTAEARAASRLLASDLAMALRARPPGDLARMLRAYPLASPEGQALMGLAEALLRIPDDATREALLRDKLVGRRWHANTELRAAGWLAASPFWPLAAPFVRRAAQNAIGKMADDFVLGETMEQALARAALLEAKGFRYSYDMLGEAALTAEDAAHYYTAYENAIQSARADGGLYENAGVSIKLSALHPRYCRAQRGRVLTELLPDLAALALQAKTRNIGFTIDAEEADRLDLSLDLLQALCEDPALAGWQGLGFAVQAYQKRAPAVLDFCIDLARRTGHRLMLRLVKGAYWDSEIKQAQIAGFDDYPVFTRKIHTDISYLACARKLLDAGEVVFPQFATHNALAIASIHEMAGGAEYEFQCLHGMGEDLYEEVWQRTKRPCRIYAPVGPHARLLAYLSRRLLENGANGSFVNQMHDAGTSLDDLLRDPLEMAREVTPLGAPHPDIPVPKEIFGPVRQNSAGLDLADEATLATLANDLAQSSVWPEMQMTAVEDIETIFSAAADFNPPSPLLRHGMLREAADSLERNQTTLLALLIRESNKTIPAASAEIREAVDYCRYYAALVKNWPPETHIPLGTVVCISPWNFPLAIFVGQIAGAFAAGNAVVAKPAEETPRIAAFAVKLLHGAGIPRNALHLVQGDGAVGAALVRDVRARGVAFTGGLEAAKQIQRILAGRVNPGGLPVPLIAETGGQNAMIVDSSALPEQVIADVLYSAFDSAGQRCSSLRLLCLHEEAAPLILPRLREALAELRVQSPDRLAADIGPVISESAAEKIKFHIAVLREAGCAVTQAKAPAQGNFVPPTIIEIPDFSHLREEVFGPVLHVFTYRHEAVLSLARDINALGYGLTFGIHSRLERRTKLLTETSHAGNVYVNRNMVGAVVGVQPFGGQGLSGTGPKAGGPLYPHRLLAQGPAYLPAMAELPGPVGEQNLYKFRNRGRVLCIAKTGLGRQAQAEAIFASGASVSHDAAAPFSAVLLEGDTPDTLQLQQKLAERPGAIILLQALSTAALAQGAVYNPAWLVHERVISTNTAAAGGNAALVAKI